MRITKYSMDLDIILDAYKKTIKTGGLCKLEVIQGKT